MSAIKPKNSFLERFEPNFEYLDAFFMFYISYQYLSLWFSPEITDAQKIYQMAILMGFEFIMVHSGAMMAAMPRIVSLLFLVPVYGTFAYIFHKLAGDGSTVLYIYLIAVFNRMRFAFFNVDKKLKNQQILNSVLAAMLYFVLIFITAFSAEHLPQFGLTEANLEQMGYDKVKLNGGIFTDLPQSAMFMGTVYYFLIGLLAFPFFNTKKLFRRIWGSVVGASTR